MMKKRASQMMKRTSRKKKTKMKKGKKKVGKRKIEIMLAIIYK
jgi:hypothetical protein